MNIVININNKKILNELKKMDFIKWNKIFSLISSFFFDLINFINKKVRDKIIFKLSKKFPRMQISYKNIEIRIDKK